MTERSERDTVSFEIADRIAWLRFNRPEKRNAMSPKLNRRMMEALDELEFRDDVGVLVLTGEGAAWTAGMDLKEYFRETEAGGLAGTRKAQREVLRLVATPALVPEADHRDGQRLVLRRRLRAALRLRSRLRRRGRAIRPLRDQLGHPSRRRRDKGRARAHDVSQRDVSCADRRSDRRPQGGGMGLRQ